MNALKSTSKKFKKINADSETRYALIKLSMHDVTKPTQIPTKAVYTGSIRLRETWNGVVLMIGTFPLGGMCTSPICDIKKIKNKEAFNIYTLNSVYRLERIK